MKKGLIAIIIIILLIFVVWGAFLIKNKLTSDKEVGCTELECHGDDVTCGIGPLKRKCLQMVVGGDECRGLARCEMINEKCQRVEQPGYQECVNKYNNTQVQVVSNKICTYDNNCTNGQFCAFLPSSSNIKVGNCSAISEKEGKNCTITSDCGYGYSCTKGHWGTPPPNVEEIKPTCIRNLNPSYLPQ